MKYLNHFVFIVLVLILSACQNSIEGPDDIVPPPTNNSQTTFSSIQQTVFTPSCAVSGCHNGLQSPNLSSGQAYANLVGVVSQQNPPMLRVKPGESGQSYLIKKLRGENTTVMPPGGALSPAVIDSIARWIDRGALND